VYHFADPAKDFVFRPPGVTVAEKKGRVFPVGGLDKKGRGFPRSREDDEIGPVIEKAIQEKILFRGRRRGQAGNENPGQDDPAPGKRGGPRREFLENADRRGLEVPIHSFPPGDREKGILPVSGPKKILHRGVSHDVLTESPICAGFSKSRPKKTASGLFRVRRDGSPQGITEPAGKLEMPGTYMKDRSFSRMRV